MADSVDTIPAPEIPPATDPVFVPPDGAAAFREIADAEEDVREAYDLGHAISRMAETLDDDAAAAFCTVASHIITATKKVEERRRRAFSLLHGYAYPHREVAK